MNSEARLTVADVAQQLKVSATSVRMWERLGRITAAVKTTRGMRLFTQAEVARVAALRAEKVDPRSRWSG